MKIHSKDYDYYDSATFGWHTGFHWTRPDVTEKKIDKNLLQYWDLKNFLEKNKIVKAREDYNIFVVCFCGKFFSGVEKVNIGKDNEFIYVDILDFINVDKSYFKKYPYYVLYSKRYSGYKVIFIPLLKDFEFFKVIDPFTAHQLIERYLTNELANQNDGSDLVENEKQILQRHGFNKCSFKGKHTGRKKK